MLNFIGWPYVGCFALLYASCGLTYPLRDFVEELCMSRKLYSQRLESALHSLYSILQSKF